MMMSPTVNANKFDFDSPRKVALQPYLEGNK